MHSHGNPNQCGPENFHRNAALQIDTVRPDELMTAHT